MTRLYGIYALPKGSRGVTYLGFSHTPGLSTVAVNGKLVRPNAGGAKRCSSYKYIIAADRISLSEAPAARNGGSLVRSNSPARRCIRERKAPTGRPTEECDTAQKNCNTCDECITSCLQNDLKDCAWCWSRLETQRVFGAKTHPERRPLQQPGGHPLPDQGRPPLERWQPGTQLELLLRAPWTCQFYRKGASAGMEVLAVMVARVTVGEYYERGQKTHRWYLGSDSVSRNSSNSLSLGVE